MSQKSDILIAFAPVVVEVIRLVRELYAGVMDTDEVRWSASSIAFNRLRVDPSRTAEISSSDLSDLLKAALDWEGGWTATDAYGTRFEKRAPE